jgi:hypothetical protein
MDYEHRSPAAVQRAFFREIEDNWSPTFWSGFKTYWHTPGTGLLLLHRFHCIFRKEGRGCIEPHRIAVFSRSFSLK